MNSRPNNMSLFNAGTNSGNTSHISSFGPTQSKSAQFEIVKAKSVSSVPSSEDEKVKRKKDDLKHQSSILKDLSKLKVDAETADIEERTFFAYFHQFLDVYQQKMEIPITLLSRRVRISRSSLYAYATGVGAPANRKLRRQRVSLTGDVLDKDIGSQKAKIKRREVSLSKMINANKVLKAQAQKHAF